MMCHTILKAQPARGGWDRPELDGIHFVTTIRAITAIKQPLVVCCIANGAVGDIHDGVTAWTDDDPAEPFDVAALRAKLVTPRRG